MIVANEAAYTRIMSTNVEIKVHFPDLQHLQLITGKNDLTRRVTHREAVFGTAIHSIFDAWHNDVLWTYMLTRLL